MVDLNESGEQLGRAAGERGSGRRPRSRHNRGARIEKNREEKKNREPSGLLKIEKLARKTVKLIEKYSNKSEHNYERAMDMVRRQFNMNFILVCEKCGGPHIQDELVAPER